MEPRALKRTVAAGLVALVLVAVAVLAVRGTHRGKGGVFTRSDARAPEGVRVRVQVLNATRVRGLARRATLHLRDRGFDVVETGTTQPARDSTLVLDRSNHPEWAALVAKALGATRVESRPDTSRYLDVTVLLGDSWRPPAEPFYP
ncbi:MAG TPA: LytR C-terminal domain-containing protein [Gemmatimonadaceae bacterium]|nr:LytR C-terminal domain-containing protein [Gemmatimonadaceae bacterium]